MSKKACVLVCVTQQPSCEKLITAGSAIAKKHGLQLRVISVCPEKENVNPNPETLEQLYSCCKKAGAGMDVFFSDTPAVLTGAYAVKNNAQTIVTGFPGEKSSRFIAQLRMLLPKSVISMVGDDGRIYNMIPDAQTALTGARAK